MFVEQGEHDSRWSLAAGHRVAMFARPEPPSRAEAAATVGALLDAWGAFMDARGLEYWLTFGSLLGQVRDQRIIPWDGDCDVGVTSPTLERLSGLLRGGAEFGPGAEAAVAVLRFGQDPDCLALKFVNSTNGLFLDVMVFRAQSAALTTTCNLHRGSQAPKGATNEQSRWACDLVRTLT